MLKWNPQFSDSNCECEVFFNGDIVSSWNKCKTHFDLQDIKQLKKLNIDENIDSLELTDEERSALKLVIYKKHGI